MDCTRITKGPNSNFLPRLLDQIVEYKRYYTEGI
jgi:hypothetical protein